MPKRHQGADGGKNPPTLTQILLAANLIVLFILLLRPTTSGDISYYLRALEEADADVRSHSSSSTGDGTDRGVAEKKAAALADESAAGRTESETGSSTPRDFLSIARKTGTDKVKGEANLSGCIGSGMGGRCSHIDAKNPLCRPFGHFYHTIYNRWLGKYSTDDAEPFQFLEIGFYNGLGFEAYLNFLPKAEAHSMEISCLPPGPRSEGKWPEDWGNFAAKNKKLYQPLLDRNRLHCGDASDVSFLTRTWTEKMKREDAPPLKVVIDDGSHLAAHMVQTVFFWFPRIEPGGVLVVEDIQPTAAANRFRTEFLPQIMADIHYCGVPDDADANDGPCFPTLQPLLHSIHCELHICVLERNSNPAADISLEESKVPSNALDKSKCSSMR